PGRGAPSTGCWRLADPLGVAEVRRALEEDRARDDVTTRLLGAAAGRAATAAFLAEGRFVVAGLPLVGRVYAELDRAACLEPIAREGAWVEPGLVLARVRATAATLLAGERVALNFLQRLSGVATLTRRAVEAVAGTAARITHTRKSTPGLRALERYAVTVGGGVANRGADPVRPRGGVMSADWIGWLATVLFAVSYFCRTPAMLRRVQGVGALTWMTYGALIHSLPVVVANIIVATVALWSSFARPQKV